MGLTICTIVARNYLPQARVLAESFASIHPEGRVVVLVFDDLHHEVDGAIEPFEVWRLEDLGEDLPEFHRMAVIYDVMEFATSLKPWLLESLLDSGASEVLYLDPDIQVFGDLNRLGELAGEHGIVLTPHATTPYPRDGKTIPEDSILFAGIYNLGFIGVGQRARPFLRFWQTRLRRECVNNQHEARFVDQRWVDFVPGMFDCAIVRDPEYNIAYWNLATREFRWTGQRYEVDGRPLAFFHFSGYSPNAPYRLSKHQGDDPRTLMSEHPDVARICDEYGTLLVERGYTDHHNIDYGFSRMADGSPIDEVIRILYRQWVKDSDEEASVPPPDPFDPGQLDDLIALLNQPPNVEWDLGHLSLYLGTLYASHPELHDVLPAPQTDDRPAFLEWAYEEAEAGRIAHVLLTVPPGTGQLTDVPPPRSVSKWDPPDHLEPGLTVAGYFNAELGVGEGGRLTAQVVEGTGIDFTTVTVTNTKSRQSHPFEQVGEIKRNLNTNIVAVNADQFPQYVSDMGPEFFSGRHTIGQWAWEIDEFPSEFWPSLDLVDEVWALSDFTGASIAAVTDKPVFTVPLPILEPTVAPGLTRASFDLPEQLMFLFAFDLLSVLERKNPLGLVEAFMRAFAPGDGPVLVLKIINGDQRIDDLERIRWVCRSRPDIVIIDRYLRHDEYGALVALSDCYVSLHRSEGLGLTMGEAMALGKPVIATGYSGNLDFMDSTTAYLVPWKSTSVPPGCDPYPIGATWADPDLDAAAGLMRHVASHREEAAEMGRRARQAMQTSHGVERAAAFVRQRFEKIQHGRSTAIVPEPSLSIEASADTGQRAVGSVQPRRSIVRRIGRRVLERHDAQHAAGDRATAAALESVAVALGRSEQGRRTESLELARSSADAQAEIALLRRRVAHLLERHESLERDLTDGPEGRIAIQDIHRTVTGLRAIPYMGTDSPFLLSDRNGNKTVGYSSNSASNPEGYAGFEDVFRGSEEFIRTLLTFYLPLLSDCSSVIDIGCGRGEMLDVLAKAGIAAVGVDTDESMIKRCERKGHKVQHEDALTYLPHQKDRSIGAVFSAQVIEHLAYGEFIELLQQSLRVLEPGGLMVAETVNPHAAHGFKTFWVDMTHRVPIFPEVLVAHCRDAGFAEAKVVFPGGTGELEVDRWAAGQYAVVARTAEPS